MRWIQVHDGGGETIPADQERSDADAAANANKKTPGSFTVQKSGFNVVQGGVYKMAFAYLYEDPDNPSETIVGPSSPNFTFTLDTPDLTRAVTGLVVTPGLLSYGVKWDLIDKSLPENKWLIDIQIYESLTGAFAGEEYLVWNGNGNSATILVSDIETAKYFEEVVAKMGKNRDMKLAVNWITGELFAVLNNKNLEISESPISAKNLAKLINLIKNGTISGKIAKDLFEITYIEGGDPAQLVEERGMKQVTDSRAIEAAVDKIIAENPSQVDKALQNPKLAGWFVGQVMKATGGKANPKAVNEMVVDKLKI